MTVKSFLSTTKTGTLLVIYWPVLFGMPVALLTPINALSFLPFLQPALDWLALNFPIVAKLSSPTDFPQVAELFYTLMFLLAPLLFGGLLWLPESRIIPLDYHVKHKIAPPLTYFFILCGLVIGLVSSPEDIDPLGGAMKLTQHSRFGLGFVGSMFVIGVTYLIYAIFLWLKRIPKIYKFNF